MGWLGLLLSRLALQSLAVTGVFEVMYSHIIYFEFRKRHAYLYFSLSLKKNQRKKKPGFFLGENQRGKFTQQKPPEPPGGTTGGFTQESSGSFGITWSLRSPLGGPTEKP